MPNLKSLPTVIDRIALLLLSLSAFVGCGEKADHGVSLNPVHGSILRAGEPLTGAEVKFYPVGQVSTDKSFPIPKGVTDEAGKFTLRTFDPDDGAPAGEYAVTLRLVETIETKEGPIKERDQLGNQYADPKSPVGKVTVEAGTNSLEPFTIE